MLAVPCCDTLCSRLWLVMVVLALLRSVLDRIWTSAVGRELLRLLEMTILLVPTLVPCGERMEFSVECELDPANWLLLCPPCMLVRLSFAMPELPLVLLLVPSLGFVQRKHLGNQECIRMNLRYSLRT